MNSSDFYLKKRQQEQDNVKKLLIASFIGSTLLHGMLIALYPAWKISQVPEKQEKPIELILVDKPKPKPIETKVIPQPKPKPKPKPRPIETKVVPKPRPRLTPRPRAKTPPKRQPTVTPKPQVTTPTPPKPQPETTPQVVTSQPREIITTPFPTGNTAPTAPVQTGNTGVVSTEAKEPSSPPPVAVTSPPPPPPKPITDPGGVNCVANCQPKYPSALNGAEGSVGVRLTINSSGNVTGAQLVRANSNVAVNRQALLAARRMRFGKINNQAGAIVTVKINFTVKGSEFDRLARQRQAELERERKAKLEQERQQREAAAREAQLERERQAKLEEERKQQEAARQAELERQRQQQEAARQAELERQRQQESSATPANPNSVTEKEREEEMIRKFRERIQQQQE
ncbi:MAG: TonB family protein [Cyanobacteria bacterium P01_F01_bin.143]